MLKILPVITSSMCQQADANTNSPVALEEQDVQLTRELISV